MRVSGTFDVPQYELLPGVAQRGASPLWLAQLYDTYSAQCYGLACRVLRDAHLAHDVVQEVFLAVWSGNAVHDPARSPMSTWLLMVTHHKAVDAVRRHQRHAGRAAPVGALDEVAAHTDVQRDAWHRLRSTQVVAALAALPDTQREVLVLAYFGAYTQSQIAERLGVPLGTVKTRTMGAMRRLRTNLDLVAIADADGVLPH